MSSSIPPEPTLEGAVTPTDLIGAVRAARGCVDQAETAVFRLGLAWADAHPVLPGDEVWHAAQLPVGPEVALDPEEAEWFGIPGVRWDAPAAFAAANGMSTPAGRAFLRDALVVRHRLPRLYARVVAGAVPVWRARRVAQAVLGKPADVVAHVDAAVAGRAETLGVTVLERVLEEAMLRLYPEEREAEQLAALDSRHATLDERSVNHTGIAEMVLRADLPDLQDFDRALSEVAAALATSLAAEGVVESLDTRRAMAIGVLADPSAALALLQADPGCATRVTRRRVELVVHLTDWAPAGLDPVTHPAQTAQSTGAQLVQTVQGWCGRPGTKVTVRPVIDLNVPVVTDTYRPTTSQIDLVTFRDRHCVFPHCTRPARSCDIDHADGYDTDGPPGQTDTRRLAPLCRHHHRLKTHAGWRLTVIDPGTYLWIDPHDQVFLRQPDGGTRDLTEATARSVA